MKNQRDFPYKYIMNKFESTGDNYYDIGFKYAGPILFLYTWWVLLEAQKKGIKRLYFIARDGYPLYEIANIFVEKFNLDIECRYLYCSRKVLRLACYHINKEEYKKYLFNPPINSTFDALIDRFNLSDDAINEIKNQLNTNNIKYENTLTHQEITELINYLISDNNFNTLINNTSISMYNNLLNYLKEQNFFVSDHICIVDLGWFGSIQQSFKTIIDHNFPKKIVEGFYFGLYDYKDSWNSIYNAFMFSKKFSFLKIWFSPNLLECMCSAPYGQTIGYDVNDNNIFPICTIQQERINIQTRNINNGIFDFTKKIICQINNANAKYSLLKSITNSFMGIMMIRPTAEFYNLSLGLLHIDNYSGEHCQYLIYTNKSYSLYEYTILYKIKAILSKRHSHSYKIYWVAGAMHKFSTIKRLYYTINMYVIYTFKELYINIKRVINEKKIKSVAY